MLTGQFPWLQDKDTGQKTSTSFVVHTHSLIHSSTSKMSDQASDLEGVREETKSTVDPIKSFLSGGFGGIACVLVGHPFDLT
jgi:hypothetical protein